MRSQDQDEDAREADALARKLRIRRGLAILIPLLLLAAPFLWFSVRVGQHETRKQERAAANALDDGQLAALRAVLEQADERADAALDGWNESITLAALDGWRPGGTECTARIAAPTQGAAGAPKAKRRAAHPPGHQGAGEAPNGAP